MPKSSAMRYSSQRAIQSWSATSSGAERADLELPLAGHDLGVDARDARGRRRGTRRGAPRRRRGRTPRRRRRRSSRSPAARGSRRLGEAVRTAALEERVLLLDAEQRLVPAYFSAIGCEQRRACSSGAASCRAAAPRSSRACCRRRGSGRGTRTRAAARSPSCCPAPGSCSNRRSPRSAGRRRPARIFVFERSRAVGSVPSIQMYSALYGHVAPVLVARRSDAIVAEPG